MTAYGPPAPAAPSSGPFRPDRRDWLRLLGGVVFAAGALVLFIRKTDWSDWALLLVLLAPCVLLYALAFAAARRLPPAPLQGWQSAFYAFAIVLLPLVLLQVVAALDGDTSSRLNIAWVFGLSAAVAAFTALRAGAWWQMLVAGVYALAAWLALWSEVLDDPSADTFRWLLIAFALALLLASVLVGRAGRPGASDLVAAAGLAAIVAGAISLAGLNPNTSSAADVLTNELPRPTQGWNIYLLVVSLALVAYGARSRTRGPSYVGAVGLLLFIVLAGANIVGRLEGETGDTIVGWPLILLIGGAALLVLSFAAPARGGGLGTTEPPGAPTALPPGAAAPVPSGPGVPPPPAPPPAQSPPPGPGAPAGPPPDPGSAPPWQGGR
jgi:hypothetical protein